MGNYVADTSSMKSGWTPLLGQTKNTYKTSELSIDCNIADTSSLSDLFIVDENECPWNGKACLYNLENDPCETTDVASDNPDIYDKLLELLKTYNFHKHFLIIFFYYAFISFCGFFKNE